MSFLFPKVAPKKPLNASGQTAKPTTGRESRATAGGRSTKHITSAMSGSLYLYLFGLFFGAHIGPGMAELLPIFPADQLSDIPCGE